MKKKHIIILILSVSLNLFLIFIARDIIFSFFKIQYLHWSGLLKKDSWKVKRGVLLSEHHPVSMLQTVNTELKNIHYPIIEAHGHLGSYFKTTPSSLSRSLDENGYSSFINLSLTHTEKFKKQIEEYTDHRIIHFSTLNWNHVESSEDFVPQILNDIKTDIANGSRGIKLWKNFGLTIHKKDGMRLQMNDPILDPVFRLLALHKLPVFIHSLDPESFFTPADEKNERIEELERSPEWSFSGNGLTLFNQVMEERNELFKKNPDITFVALHFGESSNNLQKAKKLLDNHPNVYIDTAARIDELGRQPYSSRDFFIQYQDRILFGTDGPPDPGKLKIYRRFFETKDEFFDYYSGKKRKGFWKIYGIYLPESIIQKLYYKNIKKILNL